MHENKMRSLHLLCTVDGKIGDFRGVRKIVDHSIQQWLHTFVLQGRSHEDGCESPGDDYAANGRLSQVSPQQSPEKKKQYKADDEKQVRSDLA